MGSICSSARWSISWPRSRPGSRAPWRWCIRTPGTGTAEDAPLAAALIPLLRPLLAAGAVLVANNPFPEAGWDALPLPDGVAAERYFIYRVGA